MEERRKSSRVHISFPIECRVLPNINLINEIVEAKAKIVWCSKEPYSERYQMGLCFLEMSRKNKEQLKAFLEKIYHS
ncbi:MAG: hypothetical protein B6D55_08080 [Candidatus Omnitrophica bacterium 4484_70.2]|nr:MAG: hypothetical protein B6D55_08080 [Candidatus Omnitrophica bacterium 4484_70.2]